MSRAEFTNWAVDEAGNVVASAAFEVRWRSNNSLVTTVYDAASGVGTVSNPGTATSGGLVNFWLSYGEYEVTIGSGASAVTIPFDAAPATGVPRSFSSRAAAVTEWAAMVARSETPPVGTVWTADGLEYKRDSAATDITDLVGWAPNGDVDARHFGAVCDGATNDVTAINSAIDYLNGLSSGGTLHLPAGVILVGESSGGNAVLLKANVTLKGEGRGVTTIKLADSADAHVIAFSNDVDNQGVFDLTVDGNRANQSAGGSTHGVRLHGNDNVRLERLEIKECRYYGVGVGYTVATEKAVTDSRFVDIEIYNCGRPSDSMGDGFDAKRTERCLFQNIYIHDCEQRGLDVRGAQNVYDNIWTYDNGATGISLRALGTVASAISEKHYIKATNCFAFGNGAEGFFIAMNETPLTGFKGEYDLINCHAYGNGNSGFLHRGTDVVVRYANCTAKGNTGNGFRTDNTDSDTSCRGVYASCRAESNTTQGFNITSGVGRHGFSNCVAEANGSNDQVLIAAPDCEWQGGIVDATGQTRGLYATGDRVTVIGGDFTSGSTDALRIDGDNFKVIGVNFHQTANITCFRISSGAADGEVVACDFSDVSAGTPLNNGNTSTNVVACRGIYDPIRTEYANGNVNNITFKSAASESAPSIEASGSNTNIDLALSPKGTGNIKFGTHAAIGAETVTGYITIKDSAGNARKIAVVS